MQQQRVRVARSNVSQDLRRIADAKLELAVEKQRARVEQCVAEVNALVAGMESKSARWTKQLLEDGFATAVAPTRPFTVQQVSREPFTSGNIDNWKLDCAKHSKLTDVLVEERAKAVVLAAETLAELEKYRLKLERCEAKKATVRYAAVGFAASMTGNLRPRTCFVTCSLRWPLR